jgi:hypothetical protein
MKEPKKVNGRRVIYAMAAAELAQQQSEGRAPFVGMKHFDYRATMRAGIEKNPNLALAVLNPITQAIPDWFTLMDYALAYAIRTAGWKLLVSTVAPIDEQEQRIRMLRKKLDRAAKRRAEKLQQDLDDEAEMLSELAARRQRLADIRPTGTGRGDSRLENYLRLKGEL